MESPMQSAIHQRVNACQRIGAEAVISNRHCGAPQLAYSSRRFPCMVILSSLYSDGLRQEVMRVRGSVAEKRGGLRKSPSKARPSFRSPPRTDSR